MKKPSPFVIRALQPGDDRALSIFFRALKRSGDYSFFHPHPIDLSHLQALCNQQTRDVYIIALWGNRILAYGLLRGWDEGYDVPSLGIAVHPQHRGQGIGLMMMQCLHAVARLRGATQIRLKVYPENVRAHSMYRKLGYRKRGVDQHQWVMYKSLQLQAT